MPFVSPPIVQPRELIVPAAPLGFAVARYDVIADPPSGGADQASATAPPLAVAEVRVGAPGTVGEPELIVRLSGAEATPRLSAMSVSAAVIAWGAKAWLGSVKLQLPAASGVAVPTWTVST